MPNRVQALPGAKGVVLPEGWVLDAGDVVVVSDEDWANIQADHNLLAYLDDLGTTSDLPTPVPTWRDIQRAAGGDSEVGLADQVHALNDALTAHEADTTGVHGIDDTSLLETKAGAQARADQAQANAAAALASHAVDTTAVHGIADTAQLATRTYVDDAVDGVSGGVTPYFAVFNFASASDTWSIPHNQGTYALHVETFDASGEPKEGNVRYTSINVIEVDFYFPESGFARVWSAG